MSNLSQNDLKESFSSQVQQQYPQQLKDELKCPMCQAKYNLDDRYPINTCADQHHACLSCIQNLIKDNQPCPMCNKPFEKRLIYKNKVIGNLLFKTASIKKYKVRIMQNPQERIRKLLPDQPPNVPSNNLQYNRCNGIVPVSNYNPSQKINYQPPNNVPQPYNPNQLANPVYPNSGYNNFGQSPQHLPFMANQVHQGILAKWQQKLKPKLQMRYKLLLFASMALLLLLEVFTCLELTAYLFAIQNGYCEMKSSSYTYTETFNVQLLMRSYVTRTVFFVPAMVFGIISFKLEKFRYPALMVYFVFFFLATFIHSIFIITIGINISQHRSRFYPNYYSFQQRNYGDVLHRCIGGYEFLLIEGFSITEGVIEMVLSIALTCLLIVTVCAKPNKSYPLLLNQ